MPTPQFVTSFRAASSERYEVIIDFAKYPIGTPRDPAEQRVRPTTATSRTPTRSWPSMSSAMQRNPNNPIPDVLDPDNDVMALQASQAVATRRFRFERDNGELGHQRDHVGRRDPQQLSVHAGQTEAQRCRDLGVREQLGRVVPSGPHAPHRLQGPGPQRQPTARPTSSARKTSSTSARARRCGSS